MSRIYRDKTTISAKHVREFFDGRARREANPVNAVMLQNDKSTIATERDEYERTNLLPTMSSKGRILDLGCGAGRLASCFVDTEHEYLGFDFSEELIAIADRQYKENENISFRIAEVPNFEEDSFVVPRPYDLIIVTGLFIYMNDDTLAKTLDFIGKSASSSAKIYIRESISIISDRITLKEFFSEELGESYNAIYRNEGELHEHIDSKLVSEGFKISARGLAFPEHLRNREETAQYYFTLERP